MNFTEPQPTRWIHYSRKTVERAERAVRCAPFKMLLFATMREHSVDLKAIASKAGVQHGYTHRAVSELAAENSLLWLIQVGVLRREVDGQGITDSFRLTPLGHQLINHWQQHSGTIPAPRLLDRVYNSLSRWVRLPGWIQ
ncbi:hypothetical protein IQ268_17255 [Oculatella sp. LEGE 06141]|uniref:Npun_F0494 family protein n=1 Tax=Oculatella sp. LEGE 06141 TaxID=1828648 RepID=UPI001881022B|nr:Npun_F0494 family protein [Oculatella sp. LEGE 06141]MBE9180312.1 hypothetical protein [Oculatella sp. LEGE 06141]